MVGGISSSFVLSTSYAGVKLSAVIGTKGGFHRCPDLVGFNSALSGTKGGFHRCPGLHGFNLSAVRDFVGSNSALFGTAFGPTLRCPVLNGAKLSAIRDCVWFKFSAVRDCMVWIAALSNTAWLKMMKISLQVKKKNSYLFCIVVISIS